MYTFLAFFLLFFAVGASISLLACTGALRSGDRGVVRRGSALERVRNQDRKAKGQLTWSE